MDKKELFTIPNLFTFARIPLLIVMWYFFFQRENQIIGVLLGISLLTDFFDGFFARKLNQETKFGAKFDSYIDNLTWISVIIWIPFLLKEMFTEHMIIVLIGMSFIVLSWLIATIKFKKNPEFHLISDKIMAVFVGSFYVHAFIFNYNRIWLYTSLVVVVYTAIEEIVITFKYDNIDENVKTMFQKK